MGRTSTDVKSENPGRQSGRAHPLTMKPKFYPGDIVRCNKTQNLGVIVDSSRIISGSPASWNSKYPIGFNNPWQYAIQACKQGQRICKYAWYTNDEIELIEEGVTRKYL